MNREQGRALPASKSHGKVNVSRNGRGREGEGEEENVNVSVLDGTTCLEASHYLYDSLFILKLTRRNCDSWQGEKGGELGGREGNDTGRMFRHFVSRSSVARNASAIIIINPSDGIFDFASNRHPDRNESAIRGNI